jgi:hypothetical protein
MPRINLVFFFLFIPCAALNAEEVIDARITSVQGKSITINKGKNKNISAGSKCHVFLEISTADKKRFIEIGECTIKDVKAQSSIAEMISQEGNISAGYAVKLKTKSVQPIQKDKREPGREQKINESARSEHSVSEEKEQFSDYKVESLIDHSDFHFIASSFADAKNKGEKTSGKIFYATFSGSQFELKPFDESSGLAPLGSVISFPGSYHTCFTKPDPHHCALSFHPEDIPFLKLEAKDYKKIRDSAWRGEVELQLYFLIDTVVMYKVPPFNPKECMPENSNYTQDTEAPEIIIKPLGGKLSLVHENIWFPLFRKTSSTEDEEYYILRFKK